MTERDPADPAGGPLDTDGLTDEDAWPFMDAGLEPEPDPAAPDPVFAGPDPALGAPQAPTPLLAPEPGPRRGMGVVAVLLVLSLVVNGVVVVALQGARTDLDASRARVTSLQEDLERLRGSLRPDGRGGPLDQIAEATARLRGLSFERRVEPELLSPADFAARVRALVERDLDRAEFDASQRVLQVLGIIDPGVDLYDTIVDLHEEQVAGFYDTDDKRLVAQATDASNPSPLQRTILAHEYTHALTDQRFTLADIERMQDDGADDEALAYLALAEGDASLVQELYTDTVLTEEERGRLVQEALGIELGVFQGLPKFIQDSFTFPYTKGLEFVRALHSRGGFALVDKAYADPPTSTEQILHPTRYIDDRDDPVGVEMPDLARRLGSGWKRLDEGSIGEFDLRGIADHYLSFADAVAASTGWDGGRYAAYGRGAGTVVAVSTVWDSLAQAREAATLFGRWLPLRYGNKGKAMTAVGGRGWDSPSGAGAVVRREGRVIMVLGPDRTSVDAALAAF